jgi:rhodanese-related sulfurtransferase
MKILLKILILSFLNTLMACGQQTYEQKLASLYKNSVPVIQPAAFEELKKEESLVILDTRTAKEYSVSHIQNAQFIDYDRFTLSKVENIDKNQPIVVYCSVGYRSERIGEKLKEAGFTNVQNLYGGIFQWKNEDHPVVNQENIVTDSVHTYNKKWGQWLEDGKGIKVYD